MKPYITPNMQSFKTGEDLSSNQYRFVKFHTTADQVVAIDAATDIPCGVQMNAPESGEAVDVAMIGGGAKLEVDAGIAAGNFIGSGADGKGEKVSAGSGTLCCAIADAMSSSTSSSGDVIPVVLTYFYADRDAADVITSEGDVVQGGTSGVPERLGVGTTGQVIQSNGTKLTWANAVYAEKTTTLEVSKAQLLALNGGTGGDLQVLAGQAGVVYIPEAIQIFADFDTAEYTGGDDLVLVAGTVASGTTLANIDKTAFIPGTDADTNVFMKPDTALWNASATAKGIDITALANTALSFNIKSGGSQFTDPGTAAGTFKVKVHYREVSLVS